MRPFELYKVALACPIRDCLATLSYRCVRRVPTWAARIRDLGVSAYGFDSVPTAFDIIIANRPAEHIYSALSVS